MAAVALSVQHATCLTCVSCVTRRDGQFEVAALGVDVVHAAVNGRIFLYLHEGRLSLFIYFFGRCLLGVEAHERSCT